MNLQLSEEVEKIIDYSREEATRLGNYAITPEHFLLGMIRHADNEAVRLFTLMDVKPDAIKKNIENIISTGAMLPYEESERLKLSRTAEHVLRSVYLESMALKTEGKPTARHLLLSLLHKEDFESAKVLEMYGITYKTAFEYFTTSKITRNTVAYDDDADETPESDTAGHIGKTKTSAAGIEKPQNDTPMLDNYGTDLTAAALAGKLDPVVGREKEIERLAQILSRRKKNNPVLIGDPGVGKSAIAEGLALRIAQRKVSRTLLGKRIITLDVASIVAGTKYRGQFEERIKAILNEMTKTPNLILFIDELHTLVGAGGAGGTLDAANMLKPALARGEIQCIGATTLDEYRNYIEKDGALERRFQKIIVEPTTADETLEILRHIKERYEIHHHVIYTPEAINACVYLTQRYITDRSLPDKAIDALDEAGARVHIENTDVPPLLETLEKEIENVRCEKLESAKKDNYEAAAVLRSREADLQQQYDEALKAWNSEQAQRHEAVDAEKVAEVVSMMANVPIRRVAEEESIRLLKMGDELKGKVIGQDEAVDKVVRAIQRNRAGLKDPNKPIGSFIFLGPTGVGKTQLAKVLTEYLFDTTDNMIRIDMSEYMEKHTLSRLIGAPPGYVGYEEGGQLTERVRRKPYAVVLLDEIEKAHADIFNLLLQVLDDGMLTDSTGRKIDFRNTVLIMTSNIGSREVKDFGKGVGFANATKRNMAENTRDIIEKALRKSFTPEFLNRVDEQVVFNTLSQDDMYRIIDIELKEVYARTRRAGYELEITPDAQKFIAEQGFDPQFGARPLKRAIQRYVEDPMSEAIIKLQAKTGEKLQIVLTEDGKGTQIAKKSEA
ncbi:MAG: ATP-dependent Clp protease ATP-binding subunit [Prevotellaceae bacterium]|jgi:ATP-dependent Clp protease ATP-binding subunit ClpC|nr:ATP-dependent Clp protease ATP-binding subunit [Prevotellaceae bacterium]